MQYKQKIITTVKLLLTIVFLIALVVVIRYCLVESYRISTASMGNTLKEGDFILVNKWKDHPDRNEVILFISPLLQDTASSPLFLSRCIGLPGDTIQVSNDGYTVNGQFFPLSPHAVCQYQVDNFAAALFLQTLDKLGMKANELQNGERHISLTLTSFEEYTIREELPEDINRVFIKHPTTEYSLIVPRRPRPYRIDENCLIACKEAILSEEKKQINFKENKLYIDGKETDFFFFDQDYYWVLSDNVNEGVDSRHLGCVPAKNILGTASFCWFSKQAERFFKPVN